MQYDQFRDSTKEGIDAALKAFGTVSQNVQAIAVEAADFGRKSFEQGTAALEKLTAAKSLDKAIEVQAEYARTAYEGLVAQGGRMGALYANLAKDAMKPFEAFSAGRRPAA
jgi:hypothetical protein